MTSKKIITVFLIAIFGLGIHLAAPTFTGAETPKKGGTLRIAMEAEPPSTDPHTTTATIVMVEGMHWLESPFVQGGKYEVIPDLAESYKTSDDNKVWDIKFREGVLFHNGKELTSEDVVASINRWGKKIAYGRTLFKNIEGLEATGKYTIRLTLKKGSSVVSAYMTQRTRCFIYPKEVVEEAGEGSVKTHIGTGPFVFAEHKPDRYIRMKRFDKYTARNEPQNGYGGKKVAYVDEILFIPVPEPTQRINLLQGGEADFGNALVTDAYARLHTDPNIDPMVVKSNWIIGVFNKKKGLFTNKKLRQAVQATFDMDPIMMNAVGSKEFYRLDPNLHYKGTIWWTDVGKKWYNQANPEKAKRLMKEAGYKGETVRWLTTKRYSYMYNSVVIAAQQLRDVGFKVDVQVMDWATLVKRRYKPDEYEIFTTGTGIFADPSQGSFHTCGWAGWTCFEELDDLMQQMITQSKYEERYETWKKVETFFYENAVNIKFGDYFSLRAKQKYVKGYVSMELPFFWNVWLDK